MTAPFIHVATYPIKEGKLDAFKLSLPRFFEIIEANEPIVLAIHAYLNEEGTEVTIIQVHPDAASLERHFRVAHEHTDQAFGEFVKATTSIHVYGEANEVVLHRMRQHAKSGVVVAMMPQHIGGFTRLPNGGGD